MADIPALLKEVGELPDTERSLWGHNERVLIEFSKRLGKALEEAVAPADTALVELLARILDEPLVTLPGSHVDEPQPFELRLHHFRPDLSETAAALLEKVGG